MKSQALQASLNLADASMAWALQESPTRWVLAHRPALLLMALWILLLAPAEMLKQDVER